MLLLMLRLMLMLMLMLMRHYSVQAIQKGFFLARTVFCAQGLLDETAEQVHGINVFDFKGTFLVKLHMLGIYDATYVCFIRHLKY